ncbi:MAG: hypothetical protein P8J32_01475 [bacterium]|nr:hypothetical protein [bacterium]
MGQYYKPISIDAKEFVCTHDAAKSLGADFCGAKLMEHSWLENKVVRAALLMLSEGGAWHKTKIVWCGDYADSRSELILQDEDSGDDFEANYYAYASEKFTQVDPTETIRGCDGYILNHDTKEYVCLQDTPPGTADWMDDEGWQIHPLPLLTCDGNGRGGGDFGGDDPNGLIGKWAYNRISYQTRKPLKAEGFTKLEFDLTE